MSQIGSIAAQGLAFQATQLAVAAANIVNARVSTPATADGTLLGAIYQPQAVIGTPIAGGGVHAQVVAINR